MTSDVTSNLAKLRAGTRDAHARIEMVPALGRLLHPDLTRDEYVAVLRHLHAFHASAEPAVAIELDSMPEAAALLDGNRPRALAEDLAWFGAPPVHPPRLPALDGPSAALGALYVIEGSGLGGRVIARHLVASLGVAQGAGGSFYCRQDAETARQRWQNFIRMLEHSDLDAGAMVAGALTVFACLDNWMRTIEGITETTLMTAMAEAVAP